MPEKNGKEQQKTCISACISACIHNFRPSGFLAGKFGADERAHLHAFLKLHEPA